MSDIQSKRDMTARTLTITRRSWLGFSWTNHAERWVDSRGQSHLQIEDPGNTPLVIGPARLVYEERMAIAQRNNGNEWNGRWFVCRKGKYIPVFLSHTSLWILLTSDPTGKRTPRVDSIEARVIEENAE